jgi:prepilin-type N-terminal cleavage/methylation domain-containing protein
MFAKTLTERQAGYTLLEVVLAMTLLAVVLVPLLGFYTSTLRVQSVSENRSQAISLARHVLESARGAARELSADENREFDSEELAGEIAGELNEITDGENRYGSINDPFYAHNINSEVLLKPNVTSLVSYPNFDIEVDCSEYNNEAEVQQVVVEVTYPSGEKETGTINFTTLDFATLVTER